MSAIEAIKALPEDVRRAMILAGEVEKAKPEELVPESIEEGTEFVQMLAANLITLTRWSLALIAEVQADTEPQS